jgi:hypothetical protein
MTSFAQAKEIFEKYRPWSVSEELALSIFWKLLCGATEKEVSTQGLNSQNREPVMTRIREMVKLTLTPPKI